MAAPQPGKKDDKKKSKSTEYNPRWRGYLLIVLSSLINLCATCNVTDNNNFHGVYQVSIVFGILTFALSFLILLFDLTKWLSEKLGEYNKVCDGKLEGATLVFFVLWWLVGVSYQTQVDGIAYLANNVYFSSWMSFGSCIYTLNSWCAEKEDLLSLKELTSISETLPSWYLLMFGSLVVAGTSVQVYVSVFEDFLSEAALGMALGLVSIAVSAFWIMTHYNFIEFVNEGGWIELGFCFICILVWIVAVSVLTQEGAIAATLVGSGCGTTHVPAQNAETNCTITWYDVSSQVWEQDTCNELIKRQIPGSNLYCSLWLCLGSSLNLAFKWKQQQARNFAQAQQKNDSKTSRRESAADSSKDGLEKEDGNAAGVDDDDDDDDDFEEADVF